MNSTHQKKKEGRRLLTKLAASAAVVTAAAVALGGPAHAYTAASGAYQSGTSQTYSDGTSTTPPPTQNLANLSNNMRVVSKGVTAAVHFDRGLVSGGSSVAVTVKWGTVAQTSGYYNNTYGSRFAFNFPPNDGSQRWEVINVTMTETSSGATSTYTASRTGTTSTRSYSYTAGRSVPIQAIWDVTLSPLQFKLLSDCSWIGDSDIDLYFSHSAAYGTVSFSLGTGDTHTVTEFAKTWNEVGVSSDLRVPVVSFHDTDFHWSGAYLAPGGQTLSDERILPGTSHHTSFVQDDTHCRGQIDYDTYINVHTYDV